MSYSSDAYVIYGFPIFNSKIKITVQAGQRVPCMWEVIESITGVEPRGFGSEGDEYLIGKILTKIKDFGRDSGIEEIKRTTPTEKMEQYVSEMRYLMESAHPGCCGKTGLYLCGIRS